MSGHALPDEATDTMTSSNTDTDTDTDQSGQSADPEYHCQITGCDAHFPEKEQAHTHIVEDHDFASQVKALVEARSAAPETDS